MFPGSWRNFLLNLQFSLPLLYLAGSILSQKTYVAKVLEKQLMQDSWLQDNDYASGNCGKGLHGKPGFPDRFIKIQ